MAHEWMALSAVRVPANLGCNRERPRKEKRRPGPKPGPTHENPARARAARAISVLAVPARVRGGSIGKHRCRTHVPLADAALSEGIHRRLQRLMPHHPRKHGLFINEQDTVSQPLSNALSWERETPTLPIYYAVHSGMGVQLQALTNAVFLANATGRALMLPPWLLRHHMTTDHWNPRWLMGRKCHVPHVEPSKELLNRWSQSALCDQCNATKRESFSSVFAIHELVKPLDALTDEQCQLCNATQAYWCPQCTSQTCTKACKSSACPHVDLDTHLLHLAPDNRLRKRWVWSTTGKSTTSVDCAQTLKHLTSSPRSCARLLHAVASAGSMIPRRQNRSALCVGPLNDWLFEMPFGVNSTLLGRCASSHPVARRLLRQGLPLRRDLIAMLPRLFPQPCNFCVYVRLPDGKRTLTDSLSALQDAIFSRDGQKLLGALSDDGNVSIRSGGLEIVSGCTTESCRQPFSHNSTSRAYLGMSDKTRLRLQHIGSRLLADRDVARERAAVYELQTLGLGLENARIIYDQLRCARCGALRGMAGVIPRGRHASIRAGFRTTSSFFQTIERMHHQLLDLGITAPTPSIAGATRSAPRDVLPAWNCDVTAAGSCRESA